MESSLRNKEEGNRSFKSKDLSSAITSYRRGLSSLPPPSDDEERTKCEAALRSNLALCLLRLAENPNIHSSEQIRDCLLEAEGECSAAINVESGNAKLWYRRGQSRLLLAHCSDVKNGSSDDAPDTSYDLLLSGAETDMKHCEELLQQQLEAQKKQDASKKAIKATIQQIQEAKTALKRIENDRTKTSVNVDNSSNSSKSASSLSKLDNDGKNETKQRKKSLSSPKNGLIAQFSRSISGRHASTNQANDNSTNGSNARPPPPSASDQKEQVIQLLSRRHQSDEESSFNSNHAIYPPQKGEAYFLLEMEWWSDWCRYVHFFQSYHNIKEEDEKVLRRKVCEVDVANAKLLQYLPPGATLPPFLEREKKEALAQNDKKKQSDSSSSSEESEDDSMAEDESMVPNAIDNNCLILERNGSWCLPNMHLEQYNTTDDSNGESSNERNIPLKSNLVRGHHFEILPREAYAALRTWYGEVSSPIMRRTQSIDELPWLSKNPNGGRNVVSIRLPLYGDRWDVIHEPNRGMMSTNFFLCCACRAPNAKSKCVKCKCARYCNKDCQKSRYGFAFVCVWFCHSR